MAQRAVATAARHTRLSGASIVIWVRFAFTRWRRLFLCQRVQDLSPNSGCMLLTAVNENNNSELSLRGEPYIGRGVIGSAVLIDDGKVAGADDLPCETYR